MERYDMLSALVDGGIFLLNSPYGNGGSLGPSDARSAAADHRQECQVLRDRRLPGRPKMPAWDPHERHHAGLFLRHLGILPRDQAIEASANPSATPTAGRAKISFEEHAAVDETLAHLFEVKFRKASSRTEIPATFPRRARVRARSARHDLRRQRRRIAGERIPLDGTFPTGTAHWEKRNLALEIPAGTRKSASSAASAPWSAPMP